MTNLITIHGRLTNDPEIKIVGADIPMAKFCVAVDREGKEKKTDFFNLIAWRRQAEFCERYFQKGKEILVTGSMQCENYTDKDGNKRNYWSLVVQHIDFCGSKGENKPTKDVEVFEEISLTDDSGDLPF